MSTYALSHLSREGIVEQAYNILCENQRLMIEVNRPRSHVIYLKQDRLIIDERQRAECLSLVTTHINPEKPYFFLTENRMTRYYIDQVTFDRIARVVAQSFSWVQWTTIKGVIDDKTNTELALTHLIPDPVIDPDLSLSIRESSWIINVSHFHPDGIEDPKFIFQ